MYANALYTEDTDNPLLDVSRPDEYFLYFDCDSLSNIKRIAIFHVTFLSVGQPKPAFCELGVSIFFPLNICR